MQTTTKRWIGAAALGAGALASYAMWVEPRWLQVTHPRIHLRRLPAGLEGLTIALLTDLHFRGGSSLSVIRRACRAAMRERPDLIAVTGDFVEDETPGFDRVVQALDELNAPLGVYTVPGNHDHAAGIGAWREALRGHPRIRNLTNQAVVLEVGGTRLCVAGVDDFSMGDPSLQSLPPREQRDFTVLLAHDPDQAERSRRDEDEVDLILSGHTHGGQVRLPWVGALVNPAVRDDLYEEGLRRRPWTQVYTSRGLGGSRTQLRFLCRPEVALLHLTNSPRPRPKSRLGA